VKAIQDTDYVAFCGGPSPDWETRGLIDGATRIQAKVCQHCNIIEHNY